VRPQQKRTELEWMNQDSSQTNNAQLSLPRAPAMWVPTRVCKHFRTTYCQNQAHHISHRSGRLLEWDPPALAEWVVHDMEGGMFGSACMWLNRNFPKPPAPWFGTPGGANHCEFLPSGVLRGVRFCPPAAKIHLYRQSLPNHPRQRAVHGERTPVGGGEYRTQGHIGPLRGVRWHSK
jgi:hypothetical protein